MKASDGVKKEWRNEEPCVNVALLDPTFGELNVKLVSLVKVFTLFRLERIVLVLRVWTKSPKILKLGEIWQLVFEKTGTFRQKFGSVLPFWRFFRSRKKTKEEKKKRPLYTLARVPLSPTHGLRIARETVPLVSLPAGNKTTSITYLHCCSCDVVMCDCLIDLISSRVIFDRGFSRVSKFAIEKFRFSTKFLVGRNSKPKERF